MIKNFTPRLYQETILATCAKKNTLVVLPTGLGKTNIFLMLSALRQRQFPNSKILLIGPTRPLIEQYLNVFREFYDVQESDYAVFTGEVSPEKRAERWNSAKIIFSTPQGLENDIISGRIKLEDVSLLGVDEAHRAVGDYSYVWLAKQYQNNARYPRIIGLTASPGADTEKISEVCKNLFIEDIEVRTEDDDDVKPYIMDVDLTYVNVPLTKPFIEIQNELEAFLFDRLNKLKSWGILHRTDVKYVSKKDLLQLQAGIQGRIAKGEKDFLIWKGISVLGEVMKVHHALELIETQGVSSFYKYMEKMNSEAPMSKVKALKNVVGDVRFRNALVKASKLFEEGVQHPKMIELQKIIENEKAKNPGFKAIVFNQFRDNALEITSILNKMEGISAQIFVGQMKKGETGLTQKEQKKLVEDFGEGKFNVLVATSVGEEGLDIPKVDLVVFYEPIPSAIRHIQRRGRTGRLEKGRVMILVAEKTRDEGSKWSAHHKEKKMYKILKTMKADFSVKPLQEQKIIENFTPSGVRIYADHREKASQLIKELIDLKADLKLEQLTHADYLLSSRVGVELKNKEDFVNSIIDGRLLEQIKMLKENFERPLLVIEGEQDIYSVRNVHPNSIRGMLATIAISYGIPVIMTKDYRETAALLMVIAKREQEELGKDFSPHASRKPSTLGEQQEYIVSALPGVGLNLAKPLLRNFKSVKNVVNADAKDLEGIEKIGPK
ncbi:MAG TPA: DEAD/DEAH box helicase, partial [Candidatus Nanoarchaeia archaeon]|nr:DEAD/DEAH box helicase [Candidatus Nanoarchaeia archaeon]